MALRDRVSPLRVAVASMVMAATALSAGVQAQVERGSNAPALTAAEESLPELDMMRDMLASLGGAEGGGDTNLARLLSGALNDPNVHALLGTMLQGGMAGRGDGESLGSAAGLWGVLPLAAAGVAVLILLGCVVLCRLVLAGAVYADARKLAASSVSTVLMPPLLWALCVLMGGLLVAVFYWLVHRSTLSTLRRFPG